MKKLTAVLHREQMDTMAQQGCSVPGCNHESHEPIIFLHSRCHTGGQTNAFYNEDNRLQVNCGRCNRYICDIAVKETKPIKRCHINAALQVSYRDGEGVVKIICDECKSLLTELEVLNGDKL